MQKLRGLATFNILWRGWQGVQPNQWRECKWWCICWLAFDWGPIDYWTKFTGGKNCDIYVPSLRARACARDPATFVPPRQVLVPSTRDSQNNQNNKNSSIYMPYCIDKSLLRLRTVASLAHVIQALVQSQLQKHTSYLI